MKLANIAQAAQAAYEKHRQDAVRDGVTFPPWEDLKPSDQAQQVVSAITAIASPARFQPDYVAHLRSVLA